MKNQKSKSYLLMFTVFTTIVTIAAACGKSENEEVITFTRRDNFSENEKAFIEEYQKLLEENGISGEKTEADALHMDIPANPKNSDFSILLLDEKVYGTPAFSVLPLETRKLTEEEMRQLIYAYQGTKAETVLQDYCSYRPMTEKEQTIAENRPLSSAEAFQLRIALLSGYLMEGKRPKAQEKEAAFANH